MKKLIALVIFTFCNAIDEAEIAEKLKDIYLAKYQVNNMQIDSVLVRSNTPVVLSDLDNFRIIIENSALKRNTGNFVLLSKKDEKEHRFPFYFEIRAKIDALYSRDIIKSKTLLDFLNVKIETEDFTYMHETFVSRENLGKISARRFIPADTLLVISKVTKPFLVERGQDVTAIILEENVELEFRAKAEQDGGMGDIVRVRNKDKKAFKGKIIGNKIVEIQ